MLKIVKMMSLYFLAATICEQTTLNIPPHLLRTDAPIHHVMVSAYANHPKCTGSSRGVTSSSLKIGPEDYGRLIALSPDIAKQYRFRRQLQLMGERQAARGLLSRQHAEASAQECGPPASLHKILHTIRTESRSLDTPGQNLRGRPNRVSGIATLKPAQCGVLVMVVKEPDLGLYKMTGNPWHDR